MNDFVEYAVKSVGALKNCYFDIERIPAKYVFANALTWNKLIERIYLNYRMIPGDPHMDVKQTFCGLEVLETESLPNDVFIVSHFSGCRSNEE